MQCELDNATIHYQAHGEGRPILFLHGWSMDHRLEVADYEPIFASHAGWRRLYPDLPGMGRSIAKEGIKAQDDILAALLAFIDRVIPDQRFLLAGTSFGAYLARAIAVRRRPRVAGLLLRVPCIIPDDARRTRPLFQPLVSDETLLSSLEAREREALGDVLVQTSEYVQAFGQKVHSLIEPAMKAAAPLASDIRADSRRYGLSFDLAQEEKGFTEPTLIVAGRQDTVVGYRDAWEILESYPRATFAVIDRADHAWPVESPNLLGPLVGDWLARVALAERQA
ncbi:Pimeloyl-ACP methyl ester carboxylesterase [Enhydrobacter aerosaccus]|uniref:Pimeloyl-ACP methyl ester carboxylesterase n=1 Tax=Enhydrobacter aerosaccus TaxID=225324 RepID=A0A1T4L003_9HYPH|nr:alpha/beta hydrolase [Enhydrobacter aerosaccus]SJZ47877.1 Pimeloyl-ACP methyl ester carboxylesterase [Enhydrobacter aerosaccus]